MNWPGRVVLLIIIIVSLSLFLRKFVAALRTILAAKPDVDFRLSPLGPRIRKVLWEVVAQGQVITQRPLPGIAHAFLRPDIRQGHLDPIRSWSCPEALSPRWSVLKAGSGARRRIRASDSPRPAPSGRSPGADRAR